MKDKFMKKTLVALLTSAMFVLPSVYDKSSSAGGGINSENKEVRKEILDFYNCRKLSDSKYTRKINKNHKPRNVRKTIKKIVSYAGETDTLYIPVYSSKEVGPYDCGKYSSNVAEDVFNLKYNRNHTWNLKYFNKTTKLDKDFKAEDLDSLVDRRILQPGMKLICHNSKSGYNSTPKDKHLDIMGNEINETHDLDYLSQDAQTGSALFSHLWTYREKPKKGEKKGKLNFIQEVIDINGLKKYGLQPREIIDVKD